MLPQRLPEWPSLLLWVPALGLAIAHKSIISLHPPWTTVFQGEKVYLTCSGFHVNVTEETTRYRWYMRGKMHETTENTLKVQKSGEYRCKAPGSLSSNTVRLVFSSEHLILQTPYSVFEGDTLFLRCQKRKNGKEKLTAVQYILNQKVISKSNESWDLLIPRASTKNSGTYQCIGILDKSYRIKSNTKIIRIQELFPPPELKVTASQLTEGSFLNLSCETQVPPEQQDTPLHFTFFREDGVALSAWSRCSKLQITTIRSEDSGAYWCSARALTGPICKCSHPLQVHVLRVPASGVLLDTQPPGRQAVGGQKLDLACSVACSEALGNTTPSWDRKHTSIPGNISSVIAAGATGGLLSVLLVGALLFCCWHHRKSGDGFLDDTMRTPPTPGAGEPLHPVRPGPVDLQLLYVHHTQRELTYSKIQIIKLGKEGEANISRTSLEQMNDSVIYSELKTELPDDSAEKVNLKDEDAVESYENVLLI